MDGSAAETGEDKPPTLLGNDFPPCLAGVN